MFCRFILSILSIYVLLVQWSHVTGITLSPKQQRILDDVSWNLKVKFLNKFIPNKQRRRDVSIQALVLPGKDNRLGRRNGDIESMARRKKNVQLAQELKRRVAVDFLVTSNTNPMITPQILDGNFESSLSFEEQADSNNDLDLEIKNFVPTRGDPDSIQTNHNDVTKRPYRRQEADQKPVTHQANEAETERDMKLKLFRLMYDTVKDNDELVRKADNIKKQYENSNLFEIGFVMGAITDKVNTMSDVALTVERLYDEWKPIEHVNAYEQIANQAIEINHLIDILKSAHKKTKLSAPENTEKQANPRY